MIRVFQAAGFTHHEALPLPPKEAEVREFSQGKFISVGGKLQG